MSLMRLAVAVVLTPIFFVLFGLVCAAILVAAPYVLGVLMAVVTVAFPVAVVAWVVIMVAWLAACCARALFPR